MRQFTIECDNIAKTIELGEVIGRSLEGGEVIELTSDLGGGKTTFVRGLAAGFGSSDPVASPSFTLSYVYGRTDGKELHHFDFYRLDDPGIVASELAEVEGDPNVVVAVEWAEQVHSIMPAERITIAIQADSEVARTFALQVPESYVTVIKALEEYLS